MLFIISAALQSCTEITSKTNGEKMNNLAVNSVNKADDQWKKELSSEEY